MTTTAADPTVTTQVFRVFIKAPAQKIWDAITSPDWAEKYGYACPVFYDLKPGGTYHSTATQAMKEQGAPDTIIVGEVLEADPPRRLVQTWHPLWTPELVAEPATRLTWEILEQPGGVCRLTVTHDTTNAPLVKTMVSGEVVEAGGGWAFVLSDLKTLLETGSSFGGIR
jgi:uncharacterized protein YndB with AHSA1/START domain